MLLYRDLAVVSLCTRRTVLGLVDGVGHFGQKRTLQVLRRSYFRFGMYPRYWSEGEDTKSGESTDPRIQDGRDWTRRPCSYGHRHSPLGQPEVPVFCIHHRRIYSLHGAHTFARPVSSVLSPRVSVWCTICVLLGRII